MQASLDQPWFVDRVCALGIENGWRPIPRTRDTWSRSPDEVAPWSNEDVIERTVAPSHYTTL